ncbi:MAG: hypothetical protein K6F50_05490 [Kiritimatiellae bacterium]|nr:hypothetical protein [Kiritimatiellia bacterium]
MTDNLLIVPATRDTEWIRDVLPGTSPAELPVAGRRFVDYALELAHGFDAVFLEILDSHFSPRLEKSFSEPTATGFPVFYAKGPDAVPAGLRDIEGFSSPLTGTLTDGLFVVWGVAITLDGVAADSFEELPESEVLATPPGLYRRRGGKWWRCVPGGMSIDGLKAWHRLNFAVLHHPGLFTLPGYSAERNVHLGRNVVLERGATVKPPVLIQDNAWCARNVSLDGDVIVGAGSFISEGATLRRTVVCDSTFIGEGLELDGKIVCGGRIIDPSAGVWTDADDAGVACRIGMDGCGRGFFGRLFGAVAAFLRGRWWGSA